MARDSLRFLGLEGELSCDCDLLDKGLGAHYYISYMLDRTNRMFEYYNLPNTIPEPMVEYMLQSYGSVAVIRHKDDLYVMRANFGGPLDPYYRPTQAVIANPALNLSYTYRVANHLPPFDRTVWEGYEPCVRILNDAMTEGLLPLFRRYASQMVENDISIRSAQINARARLVFGANSGPEAESAQKYMEELEAGKPSIIVTRPFLEGVQQLNQSNTNSQTITQLLELHQYLKASWYNEIGLSSNFNMKREYVSSEEIDTTADVMLPLVDNMFECRVQGVEAVNKEFGTNIKVEKASAWEIKQLQAELSTLGLDGETEKKFEDAEAVDNEEQERHDNNEDEAESGESDGE